MYGIRSVLDRAHNCRDASAVFLPYVSTCPHGPSRIPRGLACLVRCVFFGGRMTQHRFGSGWGEDATVVSIVGFKLLGLKESRYSHVGFRVTQELR
jgi:hypothetical protein